MTYYDKSGKEIVEEKDCWAKNSTRKYFLRISNGHLINPHTAGPRDHSLFRDPNWIQVNKESYDLYLKFLRSKKPLFLTQAQQAM